MMSTWAEYKKKWTDCCNCPLHSQRRRVVLARGEIPCDVLFIGEAPGLSEDSLGRPFMGPAGKLLDRMVAKALDGQYRCAFANILACIPKDEDGGKVSKPSEECVEACWPRLEEFVKLAEPSVIIGVGQLTQEVMEVDVTILHPSYILSKLDISQKGLAIQRMTLMIEDTVFGVLNPPF